MTRVEKARGVWAVGRRVGWVLTAAAALSATPGHAQAPENVRLVFQLVEADGYTEQDPEIADVVSELRELFRFQGYRLAATGLVNSSPAGHAATRLTGGAEGGYLVEVGLQPVAAPEAGRQGRTTPERVRIQVELRHERHGPAMDATVTVRDGQTLVLGSTRTVDGEALILVMRASFH